MRKLASLVCVALMVMTWLPNSAKAVTTEADKFGYYESMKDCFELGDLDEAMQYITEYGLMDDEGGYRDTIYYQLYIQARQAMTDGLYQTAEQKFEVLSQISFYDSPHWYSYASAYAYMTAKQYDKAITLFAKVAASGCHPIMADAIEKMLECTKLADDENKAIDAEQKQRDYSEAMSLFADACNHTDTGVMNQALALFVKLGNYSDSVNMAENCRNWLSDAARTLILKADVLDATSIKLTIIDSNPEDDKQTYMLTLSPTGCDVGVARKQVCNGDVIKQLIPNTNYQLTLSHSSHEQINTSIEITTLRAEVIDSSLCQQTGASLMAVNRRLLNSHSLGEVLSSSKWASNEQLENMAARSIQMIPGALIQQSNVYVCALSLSHAISEEVNVQWCFRSSDGPVMMTKIEKMALPTALCISLDEILALDYEQNHTWTSHNIEVELYVNGKLTAECLFPLIAVQISN